MRCCTFHGTDAAVVDDVLNYGAQLQPSPGDHHWLGDGVYFWPDDKEKALKWTESQHEMQLFQNKLSQTPVRIHTHSVLGAEIEIAEGQMLDFSKDEHVVLLKHQFELLTKQYQKIDAQPAHNFENYHWRDVEVINEVYRRAYREQPEEKRNHFVRGLVATPLQNG